MRAGSLAVMFLPSSFMLNSSWWLSHKLLHFPVIVLLFWPHVLLIVPYCFSKYWHLLSFFDFKVSPFKWFILNILVWRWGPCRLGAQQPPSMCSSQLSALVMSKVYLTYSLLILNVAVFLQPELLAQSQSADSESVRSAFFTPPLAHCSALFHRWCV